MLKTKPEDTPKIIALAVAILAVLAYVLYSFMKGSGDAGSGPSTSSVAASAPSSNTLMTQPFASTDATAVAPPAGSEGPAMHSGSLLADNSAAPPMTARDPFRSPVAGPARPGGQLGNQYAPQNVPQPRGNLTAQVGGTIGGQSGMPMPVAAPPPSEVELKGVVSGGSRPMALLRIGNTLLNVYQGQKITKDLVVARIGVASVELMNKKDKLQIEVGSMLMASIVLPEWIVQSNPSVQTSETPAVAGEAIEMPDQNVATPVYSAPAQDLEAVPATPNARRLGPI